MRTSRRLQHVLLFRSGDGTDKQPYGHICMFPHIRILPESGRNLLPKRTISQMPVETNLSYAALMPLLNTFRPEAMISWIMASAFLCIVSKLRLQFVLLICCVFASKQYSRQEEYQSLWTMVPSDRAYIRSDSFFLIQDQGVKRSQTFDINLYLENLTRYINPSELLIKYKYQVSRWFIWLLLQIIVSSFH